MVEGEGWIVVSAFGPKWRPSDVRLVRRFCRGDLVTSGCEMRGVRCEGGKSSRLSFSLNGRGLHGGRGSGICRKSTCISDSPLSPADVLRSLPLTITSISSPTNVRPMRYDQQIQQLTRNPYRIACRSLSRPSPERPSPSRWNPPIPSITSKPRSRTRKGAPVPTVREPRGL